MTRTPLSYTSCPPAVTSTIRRISFFHLWSTASAGRRPGRCRTVGSCRERPPGSDTLYRLLPPSPVTLSVTRRWGSLPAELIPAGRLGGRSDRDVRGTTDSFVCCRDAGAVDGPDRRRLASRVIHGPHEGSLVPVARAGRDGGRTACSSQARRRAGLRGARPCQVAAGSGTRGRGTPHGSRRSLDRLPRPADHALGPLIP